MKVLSDLRWYVQPFWYNTRVWQTDGQTELAVTRKNHNYHVILASLRRTNRPDFHGNRKICPKFDTSVQVDTENKLLGCYLLLFSIIMYIIIIITLLLYYYYFRFRLAGLLTSMSSARQYNAQCDCLHSQPAELWGVAMTTVAGGLLTRPRRPDHPSWSPPPQHLLLSLSRPWTLSLLAIVFVCSPAFKTRQTFKPKIGLYNTRPIIVTLS